MKRSTAPWRYDNTTPPRLEHRDVAKPQPERQLWLAVLESAVAAAWRPGCKPRQQREHDEAVGWITSKAEHPQSFQWVCQLLGLDPEPIRQGILGRQQPQRRKAAA